MTPEAIRAAARRLEGHARRTPLLRAPALDAIAQRPVYVKAECLQVTGSFKYRGARNALSLLPAADLARGVIARSSGNHAQGVAQAAQELGIPATILMPSDAPAAKLEGTRARGAELILYDRAQTDADALLADTAQQRGLAIIHPYDNGNVIAGQGTVGLEIASQAAEAGLGAAQLLVCCGGGGLTAGVALALSQAAPAITVHPVEPDGFDDVTRSLATGRICENAQTAGSLCDAILTRSPGRLTWPILQAHCGAGLVVSEAECLRAMALAAQHLKIVIEPGGAAALAAALRPGPETGPVIAIATGGNLDPTLLARALTQ